MADPLFSSVVALLHCDASPFVDIKSHTVTTVGSPALGSGVLSGGIVFPTSSTVSAVQVAGIGLPTGASSFAVEAFINIDSAFYTSLTAADTKTFFAPIVSWDYYGVTGWTLGLLSIPYVYPGGTTARKVYVALMINVPGAGFQIGRAHV